MSVMIPFRTPTLPSLDGFVMVPVPADAEFAVVRRGRVFSRHLKPLPYDPLHDHLKEYSALDGYIVGGGFYAYDRPSDVMDFSARHAALVHDLEKSEGKNYYVMIAPYYIHHNPASYDMNADVGHRCIIVFDSAGHYSPGRLTKNDNLVWEIPCETPHQ